MVAVFVLDPTWPCYSDGACPRAQTSRVVLVDVQDPAQPRALAEQRFAGTMFAVRQLGDRLHVLAREVVQCISCSSSGGVDPTWFSFDRSDPMALPPPVAMHLSGAAAFDEEWLIVRSPGAAWGGGTPAELRLARLSDPEPALSSPLALRGSVNGVDVSGDGSRRAAVRRPSGGATL